MHSSSLQHTCYKLYITVHCTLYSEKCSVFFQSDNPKSAWITCVFCIHTHLHTHRHTHTHTYTHKHTYTHTHKHTHTNTHTHIHTQTHKHTHTRAHMHTRAHTHICGITLSSNPGKKRFVFNNNPGCNRLLYSLIGT